MVYDRKGIDRYIEEGREQSKSMKQQTGVEERFDLKGMKQQKVSNFKGTSATMVQRIIVTLVILSIAVAIALSQIL